MIEEKEYNGLVETWNNRKGNGTIVIPNPLDAIKPIYMILPRLFNKSPTCNVLIVTDDFADKDNVISYLTNQKNNYDAIFQNLLNIGRIKVLTIDWIIDNINHYQPTLVIIYNPSSFTFAHLGIIEKSIYKLVILHKQVSTDIRDKYYQVVPCIKEFKQSEVDSIRTSPPVEEYRIPITIDSSSEDAKLLKYYNDNIRIALCIFKDLDGIKRAITGNTSNNTSALAYCDQLARENGWNEHLDMSTDYNRQIDTLYSPNAIRERANTTYEMIRKRTQLVASYSRKVNAIIEIVNNNVGKKILVINKFAEFATDVTNNLNVGDKQICMNYHDKVDNIPAIDDKGNPIYYKSGAKKGERKLMGATSQKKLAQKLFNLNKINVLSANNLPDKDLNIDVDVIIITSPLCENLKAYLYRLAKVTFNTPIILYSLYCKDTMEEKEINDRSLAENHHIVNANDEIVKNDNNYAYTIVD